MDKNSFGGAAKPAAASMKTDMESGIDAELADERARFALESMFRRGLIPDDVYQARLRELMPVALRPEINHLPLAQTFRIARDAKTGVDVVTLTVSAHGYDGVAECRPYARYDETPAHVVAQIEHCRERWRLLPDHDRHPAMIQDWVPPGAARNALDCAVWDWLGRLQGQTLWQMLGYTPPAYIETAVTISLDDADVMARAAAAKADWPVLKLKLTGAGDAERLRAVRRAAPKPKLIVDANKSWSVHDYHHMMPLCAEMGVVLIEQPFAEQQDHLLSDLPRSIPVAADESCHDRKSLQRLKGLYDVVNIKLDKTGGLTEALALKDAARAAGFGVMVGCMVGSSRAIAPALPLAAGADFVDLDGPLWLAEDQPPKFQFSYGRLAVLNGVDGSGPQVR